MQNSLINWRPTASILTLKKRSKILQDLRAFFYTRDVYEVDTPILSTSSTPDLHLQSLKTYLNLPGLVKNTLYYCHTSPEYAMKRLLCAGSGDIFYLGKVFRDEDLSSRHQPEFTMLEWYRLGFSLQNLMEETAELIQAIIGKCEIEQISYQQAFLNYAKIKNIHTASAQTCIECLNKHNIPEVVAVDLEDKDLWEQLVFTEVIEPQLGWNKEQKKISCIFNYPAKNAALAQISVDNPLVAERFEVFVQGLELANGYHELQDPKIYLQRFEKDLELRKESNKEKVAIDRQLIQALEKDGLPDCSGVALGVDRLVQLALQQKDIQAVLAFAVMKP